MHLQVQIKSRKSTICLLIWAWIHTQKIRVLKKLVVHLWPDGTLMVSRAGQAFDANGELVDQKVRDQLAAFVQGFAAFAAATRR